MGKGKTLLLIDGHALAFRQFYALERTNMKTSSGTPTWAVFGFFKALFDLLKNKKVHPDAIGVAFDVSRKTFRVDMYPEYKANRDDMPDSLRSQMSLIFEGLNAFNIPIYTKAGFEADDVIGTISKRACEMGHKVLILTGDQDSFQLVDKEGCVKVIIPSKGELKEYGWNEVHEKLGVYPDQVIDYKGLCGDSSDNIPGVKGVGCKTAVRLLERFGTLQNVLDNIDSVHNKSVILSLERDADIARLSYKLATIIRDVNIDFDFSGADLTLPDPAKVSAFLKEVQFFSFLKNIDVIMASFRNDGKILPEKNNVPDMAIPLAGQQQLGLFSDAVRAEINKVDFKYDAKLITDSTDLEALADVLKTKTLFAFRSECDITSAISGTLYGLAIGFNDDFSADDKVHFKESGGSVTKTFYIPVGHFIENQLPQDVVINALKPVFENPDIKKITHEAKTEHNFLRSLGVDLQGIVFDTLLASYVKDPSRTHSIEVQAIENVDHIMNEIVPYSRASKTNVSIINVSVENALVYTSDILTTIFELTKFWIKTLDDKELKILYEMEMPLTIILANMEYEGVSVDVKYLRNLSKTIGDEIRSIEFQVYKIAGEAFNIASPKQVADVLFDKLKIPPLKKRPKTRYSTNAEVLEELSGEHEIARLILLFRKYSKLKSTYTDALPKLIDSIDGRIHTTYNQTTTATGRLSSSNPNLQNIPVRTDEGNKIRKAFVPANRSTSVIFSADYSQIELRLLAHVSGDENLIEAFKSGVDIHTITASKVFDVPLSEVTRKMRYKAKAVNFGIVYGQSKYGLAKALNISFDEAENFIDRYFATYPKVKEYMQNMVNLAEERGYVETIFGRKRYLGAALTSSNSNVRDFGKRAAINHPMQGAAADLIKLAMVDLDKKLKSSNLQSKLIMQVHDELVLEALKSEVPLLKEVVTEAMELGQPLAVPLVVDINVGATWQES